MSETNRTCEAFDVLLVEDSPSDALLVREALASAGPELRLVHVDRLAAALDELERRAVGVVLLDLRLPDSTGIATLERMHAAVPRVPIVVLTGLKDEALAIEALKRGAQDYLPKCEVSCEGLWRAIRYARERARAEAAQAQLEQQLRQAQKMETVGRLAGGIAHDFNNLLTAILGYTALLTGRLAGEEAALLDLHEVRRAGERAAALTRQLLAFSRKQVLQPRLLDLDQVVGEIGKLLERLLGEDVELHIESSGPLGRVDVDPGQVEQVIVNLAVNARDAMPEGGTLTLETAAVELSAAYAAEHAEVLPGHYVMLAVTDTGIGMDAEVMSHLFEPFFTTKEVGKGTGLGLATVYGIVRQSEGHVTVESEPGRGTTFRIYFPLAEGPAIAAAAVATPAAPEPPADGHGVRTILLVDDEAGVRALARLVLEREGYAVLAVASGEVALDVVRRHPGSIDLLLTDLNMPGMPVSQMVARVASARPEAGVVVMSGYTEQELESAGLDPDTPFLQKPFRAADLVRVVGEALERTLALVA